MGASLSLALPLYVWTSLQVRVNGGSGETSSDAKTRDTLTSSRRGKLSKIVGQTPVFTEIPCRKMVVYDPAKRDGGWNIAKLLILLERGRNMENN